MIPQPAANKFAGLFTIPGLLIAACLFLLIFVIAPRLRLWQRDKQRNRLESWYEQGPKINVNGSEFTTKECSFCGSRIIKKSLYGVVHQKKYLKKFNNAEVDETRFYELRCTKCQTLLFKIKEQNVG